MFRRLETSLPKDPSWEADLTKLGYFITTKGKIRKIADPKKPFLYRVTDNERFNETHREAFHKCIRAELTKRLTSAGIDHLYLPQLTATKPTEPSIPILTTSLETLRSAGKVIIVVNDHMQDFGVWAYRLICSTGFDTGSALGLVKAISSPTTSSSTSAEDKDAKANKDDDTALLILNPGQYYYSHALNHSLTHESWEARPRPSLYHTSVRATEEHNLVPGSKDNLQHISTVFSSVVNNPAFIRPDAHLYTIGICEGGNSLLRYLDEQWTSGDNLSKRIKAAAWIAPWWLGSTSPPSPATAPTDNDDDNATTDFATFLRTRSRAWSVSPLPAGTCIGMPPTMSCTPVSQLPSTTASQGKPWEEHLSDLSDGEVYICPTFSAGEAEYAECVFPAAQDAILGFFEEVGGKGEEGYVNPTFAAEKVSVEGSAWERGEVEVVGDGEEKMSEEGGEKTTIGEADAEKETIVVGGGEKVKDVQVVNVYVPQKEVEGADDGATKQIEAGRVDEGVAISTDDGHGDGEGKEANIPSILVTDVDKVATGVELLDVNDGKIEAGVDDDALKKVHA